MIIVGTIITYIVLNYKSSKKIRRGVYIFIEYLIIIGLLLIIIWPGTWSWDDLDVAVQYKNYVGYGWHHILTELLQMTFLQLLPIFGG